MQEGLEGEEGERIGHMNAKERRGPEPTHARMRTCCVCKRERTAGRAPTHTHTRRSGEWDEHVAGHKHQHTQLNLAKPLHTTLYSRCTLIKACTQT